MTTEQIDLAIVKELIETAKNLRSQLTLIREQHRKATQERDALTQKIKTQDSRFLQDRENAKEEHASEILSLRNKLQHQLEEVTLSSRNELQGTTQQYENKLQETIQGYEIQLKEMVESYETKLAEAIKSSETKLTETIKSYEGQLKRTRDDLTTKNTRLQQELQETQKSYQAVINRIRGIAS